MHFTVPRYLGIPPIILSSPWCMTAVQARRARTRCGGCFELTAHPIDEVAQFAFSGLFMDSDEHVRWVAAQLAMDLSLYYRFEMKENGDRDDTVDRDARKQSLARALERLGQTTDTPLTSVPPAWVKTPGRRRYGRSEDEAEWDDADPSFDAAVCGASIPALPYRSVVPIKPLQADGGSNASRSLWHGRRNGSCPRGSRASAGGDRTLGRASADRMERRPWRSACAGRTVLRDGVRAQGISGAFPDGG